MSRITNTQLRQLIIRKCGLICVIFIFTLLSFYTQGTDKLDESNQSKDVQPEVNSNEENSFYFLNGEQQQKESGLGEIDQKVLNPLNFKVQNIIKEDQSLLRSNLRKKLKSKLSRDDDASDRIPEKLTRSKRDANRSNTQRKLETTNNHDNKNRNFNSQLNNQLNRQKKSTDIQNDNQKNKNKQINTDKQAANRLANDNQASFTNSIHKVKSKLRRKRNDDEDEEETPAPSKPKTDEEEDTKEKPKTDDEEEEEEEKSKNDGKEEVEHENESEKEEKNEKEEEKKEKEVKEDKNEKNEKEKENAEKDDSGLTEEQRQRKLHHLKQRKLRLNKNNEVCTPAAYKEFPPDLFGHKLRKRGFILVHIAVTCYMFFCLAIVCDQYFLPSLELCSTKLGLSNDVAGATLMSAGSSAPELFAAILGVFIAKSDVGTGTIVGSAIFNILFVIGLCGVCAASVQLSWWPVARDSSYYCLTVFVLIIVAYDGQVSTAESAFMLTLYVGYVVIMVFNQKIYEIVIARLNEYTSSGDFSEKIMNMEPMNNFPRGKLGDNMGNSMYKSFQEEAFGLPNITNTLPPSQHLNKTSMFEAANHIIIQHNRLFRPLTRFRAAADLIVIQNRKVKISQYQQNNLGSLSRQDSVLSKRKVSLTEDIEEYWRNVPNYQEVGPLLFAKWVVVAPLYATLFFTVPNCKKNRSMFLATFMISIIWIALFSYLMVWMVTVIGYTFGIPDAIMGISLLAMGTSVPDAYTSLHVAKQGQGDMAVSNSIGSNVFDILVGLALPFFIETTIVSPGINASINSKGLFYAMILLFLSLVVTIYLFYMNHWVLNKKLGIIMIISYFVILLFCAILEFNIIDVANPIPCDD